MNASPHKKVRVLVAEDSPVMRDLVCYVLSTDPGIQVVTQVSNGAEAIDAVRRLRPDVVSMDLHMPVLDGLGATRVIMQTQPTPIVIVSSSEQVTSAFGVLEAGALAVAPKPPALDHPMHAQAARQLVQTIKLMAEVKVVRRWPRQEQGVPAARAADLSLGQADVELIAVGASTGGPIVLRTMLAGLPKDYPFPILIVQHIAQGFTEGLVDWLARSSAFLVRIATEGEHPLPGRAYVAPEGRHMSLGHDRRISLSTREVEHGHRPAVSALFRSVAEVLGRRAVGVLLTGMGKDGAAELKLMKDRGALTIAQDRHSCVVHGMPGEAILLDAATHILAPDAIAALLSRLAAKREKAP